MSTDICNRNLVLRAIDVIRSRKNRPNLERIIRYLNKFHNVKPKEGSYLLEKLLAEGLVVKVVYKGNTSYRNTLRWRNKGEIKSNMESTSILSSVIAELSVLEPSYITFGVPRHALEKHFLENTAKKYAKINLDDVLQKELDQETLIKSENGNFFLGPLSNDGSNASSCSESPPDTKKIKKERKESPEIIEKCTAEPLEDDRIGLRKCSRKRTKKYDPAEYIFPALKRKKKDPNSEPKPKKKKGRPLKKKPVYMKAPPSKFTKGVSYKQSSVRQYETSMPNASPCSICNFSGNKANDKMMSCCGCYNKGHQSCIEGDPAFKSGSRWYCPDCCVRESPPVCSVCELNSGKSELLSCDLCGETFHAGCHDPPVPGNVAQAVSQGKWRCSKCPSVTTLAHIHASILGAPRDGEVKKEEEETGREGSKAWEPGIESGGLFSSPIKLEEPPSSSTTSSSSPSSSTANHDIPDPSGWSSTQVYRYFLSHFRREVAAAFQEQDIDGESLLLLRRCDVIKGLGFKLGEALKVLYHVRKFQLKSEDMKLLWS